MSEVTRRVVTGHRPDGRSVVVSDAVVPHVRGVPGARFDEVWSTAATPERLDLAPANEPTSETPTIGPRSGGGSVIRIIEFAPASEGGVRSPMHRTRTIDYGIVIEGEVVLILSDSEVVRIVFSGPGPSRRSLCFLWPRSRTLTTRSMPCPPGRSGRR